ncbi:CCAAT- binding transcription factor component [Bonamia ostreae]|uniref:CCAAT- binding transcription factor component n=1 Tax=Bonamia ostreae TaxID=126728 RepID=A0ABV2AL97_9EUKA
MIRNEVPLVFSKAAELFILEMTIKVWEVTKRNNRKTIQKSDVLKIIQEDPHYDFLNDVLPNVWNNNILMNENAPITVPPDFPEPENGICTFQENPSNGYNNLIMGCFEPEFQGMQVPMGETNGTKIVSLDGEEEMEANGFKEYRNEEVQEEYKFEDDPGEFLV